MVSLRAGKKASSIGNSLTIKTKKEMKKNLFMVAAVALMALVSCNKEEINNGVQEVPVSDIVFEAETPMTKTGIGEADASGLHPVSWVVGDRITINGSEFKASELKDNKAIFVTENLDFTTSESYDAIYPASAGKSFAAVTIAAKQDGTFANASISVAQSETQSLSFKNVASMLKFQVPATASEVTIESTANLAGTFGVTFDNEGNPVIGQVSNGSKKITLTGSFVINTDYYVAILPGDHQFTVKIDGFLSKASTKTSTVERAKLMNMKSLPVPTEWGWLVTMEKNKYYMVKSTVYTDLFVIKNLDLGGTNYKFKFVNSDGTKTVGAYGSSTANVNCQGQIYEWYDSQVASTHAAFIYVTTSAKYDIFFSPTDLNFLIINAGKEVSDSNSAWEVVGWINNKDSWGGGSGHYLKKNYVTTELEIELALTTNDYFKFLKNKNWDANNGGGWIGAKGYDGSTQNYGPAVGKYVTINTHHSYDDHKAQFHMSSNGTYKLSVKVSDQAFTSATVRITRIK